MEEEHDVAEAVSLFVEQAFPNRTVSFAPDSQILGSSISESGYPTSSIHHPNVWSLTNLPRSLQAGIRPDTPELQDISQATPAPTPRQLALWEGENLGTHVYEQDGYFQQRPGMAEGTQEHLKMLDERMKQIASEGTQFNHGVVGPATPGYVATMRHQRYANACTSLRRSQHGLSKTSRKSRCRRLLARCDSERYKAPTQLAAIRSRPSHDRVASMPLNLEHEKGWKEPQDGGNKEE